MTWWRWAAALMLLLAALPASGSGARAAALEELRLGLLYHDPGGWGGSGEEEGVDVNGELLFSPSMALLGGTLRPNLGVSVNSSGATSKIYGGGVWEYRCNGGLFFDLGLGLTVHNGEIDESGPRDRPQLGAPVLFRLAFEIGIAIDDHHRVILLYDHISNAYLADPNEGLDTVGLRYGYHF